MKCSALSLTLVAVLAPLVAAEEKTGVETIQLAPGITFTIDWSKPDNINVLGGLYAKQDKYERAIELFHKAAKLGCADAWANLGDCYERGNGVKQDYAKALAYYTKAAGAGSAFGVFKTGTMHYQGRAVPKDFKKALVLFRKAADMKYARAMLQIGFMYRKGEGVPKDVAQSDAWYEKAANNGNTDAMFNLGNGAFRRKDRATAVKWWDKAAQNDHADAAFNLGVLHYQGKLGKADKDKAIGYWKIAARAGHEKARAILNDAGIPWAKQQKKPRKPQKD